MTERKQNMKKIIEDKKGLSYLLVGEVYYPILLCAELPIGDYAQERINYLIKYFPKAYLHLIKDKLNFKKDLFILNCLCEQEFQKELETYITSHPNINDIQRKNPCNEIKRKIIKTYVHQSKGVEVDENK